MSSALGRLAFVAILARLGLRSASDPRPVRARFTRIGDGIMHQGREHVQDMHIRILSTTLWNPSELSYLAVRYLAEEGVDLDAGCGSRGRPVEP